MSIKSDREVLEDAIFRDFEDYTTHAAYADLIAEEGDPRGEYIRLQLALENTSLPVKERRMLDVEATRLYRENFHDWFGHLDFRVSREPGPTARSPNFEIGLRRGWLTTLYIFEVTQAMLDTLASSAELRMLRELTIRHVPFRLPLADALRTAPWKAGLRNLQVEGTYLSDPLDRRHSTRTFLSELTSLETLTLGSYEECVNSEVVGFPSQSLVRFTAFFDGWPRMETLREDSDLGCLEFLDWSNTGLVSNPDRFRAISDPNLFEDDPSTEFAPMPREIHFCPWTLKQLVALFESPRYRDIRDLRLSLERIGDLLAEALVRSGMLLRLEELRLVGCGITDAGAVMLINARKHSSMKLIDLRGNPLTPAVTDRLRRLDTIVWAYTSMDDEIPF